MNCPDCQHPFAPPSSLGAYFACEECGTLMQWFGDAMFRMCGPEECVIFRAGQEQVLKQIETILKDQKQRDRRV